MTEPIARIEAALARLGAEHEPPAGWEARVLAAAVPRRRARWWFALPIVAAAAIALGVWLVDRPPAPGRLALAVTAQRGGEVIRGSGDTRDLGDVVHASATGGSRHRAIWVYRNEELMFACPGAPECRTAGGELTAEVTLRLVGTYSIVAVTSSAPIATPTGIYDTDVAGAERAGEAKSQEIIVR